MSPGKNTAENSIRKAEVHRRAFISTGIVGGLTLAFTPGIQASLVHAADTAPPAMLPTPADSLSLYMILLDRLKSNIVNPYFELLNCLSGEVTRRYDQLIKDVIELERLVPELKSRRATSNLRSVSGIGFASASLLETVAAQRVILTNASFTLASLGPETFRDTVSELQRDRGSLTLSPKAANLLRRILDEIRDLEKPSEGLGKTVGVITDLNNDLDGKDGKLTAIRQKLMTAITALVADEISSGSSVAGGQTVARENVQLAIEELKLLDAYVPPQSLKAYVSSSKSKRCEEARDTTAVATIPTQSLRELLTGTVKWIESGGQISQRGPDNVQFVKASTRTPLVPDWWGRWSAVRQVLYEHLPPASNGRTFMCLTLIAPILIGYDTSRRVNMITEQLVNLMPGRSSDRDVTRRKNAAQRLANL